MTIQLAFLRGINVGGHKPVAMADLRELLTELGFATPRSLLQSGNLIFHARTRTGVALERLLEREAERRLGLQASFLVRTAKEWERVVGHNPFPEEAERDPAHLVLMLLKTAPEAKAVRALQAASAGPEVVRADGRHAYITYPTGIGRSRLTNALIERTLATLGTARNWNTVLKVWAMAQER